MQKHDLKTLWTLFLIFLKAGTFTFAGGLAMLPMIQRDLVDKYKLMPEDEFLEYATLSQTLPGVVALNCASFVGRRIGGWIGMFAASVGAIFSAFALMIVAVVLLQSLPQTGPIAGAFRGIRAASAAFILAAAFALGKYNLKGTFTILMMLAAFALVFFANVSAPLVIIAAGVAGYVYRRYMHNGEASK
jgi:chromate transporter